MSVGEREREYVSECKRESEVACEADREKEREQHYTMPHSFPINYHPDPHLVSLRERMRRDALVRIPFERHMHWQLSFSYCP